MPKLKPGTILPTPEEDAAITAAAQADPDALPLTDAEWVAVKPKAGAAGAWLPSRRSGSPSACRVR